MTASTRYLERVIAILGEILEAEREAITAAAGHIADTIEAGGLVHTFGTGHSHLLAEELFYRAGGLGAVNPILDERLMLHVGAEDSTRFERQVELAAEVITGHSFAPEDCLIVASNSGGNAVCVEVARLARAAGVTVIAVMSRRHQARLTAERPGPGLVGVSHVVIDNHGEVGDACVSIDGLATRVAPSSTVAGAAIVNAMVAEAIELALARGARPDVFASANVPGGDEVNAEVAARYRSRVRAL